MHPYCMVLSLDDGCPTSLAWNWIVMVVQVLLDPKYAGGAHAPLIGMQVLAISS
jgi:hypothetical protein